MKKIDENTKVTLTFAQIKKLVKESTDAKFEADLEAEYKKRLEGFADTFGYKNGAELEAAMDKDDDLYQEVIATDDGDNFLDLYLNWWPDEEGFAEQDEYYHAPLRDLLEGIIYGNNGTDESVKESLSENDNAYFENIDVGDIVYILCDGGEFGGNYYRFFKVISKRENTKSVTVRELESSIGDDEPSDKFLKHNEYDTSSHKEVVRFNYRLDPEDYWYGTGKIDGHVVCKWKGRVPIEPTKKNFDPNWDLNESGRPPRIGKDCYAVNFRNMRTAIHGLFIGTKREMEDVMDILDQIEHTDDQIDLEILYDELGKYDTIEEIDFRDIGKDYTYRDWKTDKTYEVLNSSCYDIDW